MTHVSTHDPAPWRALDVWGRDVNPIPSMITEDEALYLHWLARCRYRGLGAIVDGGPLLGGSTVAFAEGLRRNPRIDDPGGRIHSYDLFEYTPFMTRIFKGRKAPAPGASLLPEFQRNVGPWQASIAVYPGDIRDRRWTGGPIEILFIDLAKTWDIQRHLLREFFPHLVPGVSVVVQQDYFFVSCYWIHLVMEALADYFRVSAMPEGPTLAFDLVAPIPPHLLERDYQAFTRDDAVALMDRSLARFTGSRRLVAETAKVSLLLAYGDVPAAQQLLAAIRSAPAFDARVGIDWDKAASRVQAASERPSRAGAIPA